MDDQFGKNTEAFLEWLNRIGVKLSPKAALADLREGGRGRALGKCPPLPFCKYTAVWHKDIYWDVEILTAPKIHFTLFPENFS